MSVVIKTGDKIGKQLKEISEDKELKRLDPEERKKLRKKLAMHHMYVKIDKYGRVFSIPKKFREGGYVGQAEAIVSFGSIAILNPAVKLEDIERSLDLQLHEIGRRLGHKHLTLYSLLVSAWKRKIREKEEIKKKYRRLVHKYRKLKMKLTKEK